MQMSVSECATSAGFPRWSQTWWLNSGNQLGNRYHSCIVLPSLSFLVLVYVLLKQVPCCGLSEHGHCGLICLNAQFLVGVTIWEALGLGILCWKRWALQNPYLSQLYTSHPFCLWNRSKFPVTSPTACCHIQCHDEHGLTFLNCKQSFFISCLGYSVSSQN